MKKQFLKILPAVAAVLLATACSKDSDDVATPANVATPENVATPTEEVTAPAEEVAKETAVFTLTVSYNTSLSKVSLVDALGSEGPKNLKFDVGDKLFISVEGEEYCSEELTADDIKDNFATFQFNQYGLEGKTKDDIESGYMGEIWWFAECESMTEALTISTRALDLTTMTLYDDDFCYICMTDTEKTVEIDCDNEFGESQPKITLSKNKYYAVPISAVHSITVDGEEKKSTLKPGKIYYVK